VTVEAHRDVYEKGIEALRPIFKTIVVDAKDRDIAVQSRATAGVAQGTYLFALPGSPVPAATPGTTSALAKFGDYRHSPWQLCRNFFRELDEHRPTEIPQGRINLAINAVVALSAAKQTQVARPDVSSHRRSDKGIAPCGFSCAQACGPVHAVPHRWRSWGFAAGSLYSAFPRPGWAEGEGGRGARTGSFWPVRLVDFTPRKP